MDDEGETYRLWRVRKTVMQVCGPDSVVMCLCCVIVWRR